MPLPAGFTWDGVIHKMDSKQWQTMLDVHVTAPFKIIQVGCPFCACLLCTPCLQRQLLHTHVGRLPSTVFGSDQHPSMPTPIDTLTHTGGRPPDARSRQGRNGCQRHGGAALYYQHQ